MATKTTDVNFTAVCDQAVQSFSDTCKGAVKKCAAKSTCGKPGFVTCCVTKNNVSKCKLKRDTAACTAKGGVTSGCTSCCDACPAPGSGPSCSSPSGAFLD